MSHGGGFETEADVLERSIFPPGAFAAGNQLDPPRRDARWRVAHSQSESTFNYDHTRNDEITAPLVNQCVQDFVCWEVIQSVETQLNYVKADISTTCQFLTPIQTGLTVFIGVNHLNCAHLPKATRPSNLWVFPCWSFCFSFDQINHVCPSP